MAKESAYFTVGGISGKHDVKEIKRGLDTLPGVLSVSVGGGRVAVDFDTTGTRRDRIGKQLAEMGYPVLDDQTGGGVWERMTTAEENGDRILRAGI